MRRVHGLNDAAELLHEELQFAFVLLNILCHQHRNLQMIIQTLVFGFGEICLLSTSLFITFVWKTLEVFTCLRKDSSA